ncbi:CYTH domain-containing protein [Lepagella muris]|jgi:CYTH domain-containing protein|uniref:CYTH domain-containing protein n=1 Tax=Lepagella muris TaxID=3032870 RepID=A0AC61RDJ6_9BACT|nr:CYTH domain-containing protein [Lepagella muris]ROT09270.1 CYTH domain-containing protein [Muribaculaceae bacterium Isolate-037 (Harlan)]TGY76899.1 CYTH domain-containing protein [Lepagella muris]THG48360.1 CYTH domain-containing protein [Bacteroidales bacterium]TKC56630.1 CYTH domain-containing protein [Bacteroidales bacterium]
MALEIERKFIVNDDSFRQIAYKSISIRQGYLSRIPERTIRVRTIDDKGFLTIKGKNIGIVRNEFEYEIPLADALEILTMCVPPILEKTRYLIKYDNLTWEVDEFHGARQGLIMAEVELSTKDTEITLPPFIGKEVTGNPEYYNSNL